MDRCSTSEARQQLAWLERDCRDFEARAWFIMSGVGRELTITRQTTILATITRGPDGKPLVTRLG